MEGAGALLWPLLLDGHGTPQLLKHLGVGVGVGGVARTQKKMGCEFSGCTNSKAITRYYSTSPLIRNRDANISRNVSNI